MQTIRIGVYDKEEAYIKQLAAYLNRYGKGQWNVVAFSEATALATYLENHTLDLLAATDRELLRNVEPRLPGGRQLWLSDVEAGGEEEIAWVYRYQSGKKLAGVLYGMTCSLRKAEMQERPVVAIYSPVGRCGKTGMALELVEGERYGRWFYIGMEDYSTLPQNAEMEDFFYFWKERQREKLLALIEQGQGRVVLARCPFELRLVEPEDISWLKDTLKESSYQGALLDVGTGMLSSYRLFSVMDALLVPYLSQETALAKRAQFEEALQRFGAGMPEERIWYVDMTDKTGWRQQLVQVFGRWSQ